MRNAECGMRNAECGITHSGNSVHGAGAPSPPSEGFGFRAPPVADTARKASRCRPQVRERTAEAVDFGARRGSALASL